MANDRSANESSTAVYRLTIIEISIVNNQLPSQSRDSEPSRPAGDEIFHDAGWSFVSWEYQSAGRLANILGNIPRR